MDAPAALLHEAALVDGPSLPLGVALCVDLDGTLVKSDTLVDSTLALARQKPQALLQLPGWLMQGKAMLKKHITSAVQLDVTHLPYNRELIQFLEQEHATGRPIYLATAADKVLAERVAEHLGLFAGVLASDGEVNLAGKNKLAAFQNRFADSFSYIGNASPDIPLLTHCQTPMVANPTPGLVAGLHSAKVVPVRSFIDKASTLKAWLKAIRLHQWSKNILIFLPLLLAHRWNTGLIGGTLVAFLSFGLCASATYIVNDLLDLEADRKHLKKRRRPFASGDLSAIKGVMVVGLFLVTAFALAALLPFIIHFIDPSQGLAAPYKFVMWLCIYAVTTSAYSFSLKRMVLVDVIVLSGLYTIRIIAGAAATGIPISPWLAAFSIFFFLSLAFVKRFAELEGLRLRGAAPANGRGYLISDIEQLRSFGSASGYVSVFVLTQYISGLNAEPLYTHTTRLWLLLPVLLLWISRLWLLASRGELDEDPVVYAITDKRSLLLGIMVVAIVLSAL
jgi:4-hydroxybenzoate polyprenyltransferase/phosphoserine phosphatase